MADKKDDQAIVALTKPLTHVNTQTFGANASTVILEVIDTPGYGGDFMIQTEERRAACLILGARVWMSVTVPLIDAVAGAYMHSQILQGDHTGDSALKALGDKDALMYGFQSQANDSHPVWPLELDPVIAEPIIITPKFTILHQAANTAAHNSRNVQMVITYQVVSVKSSIYTDMLLTQQRTS